jgi:branched-chain amino acid transport system permease protein
VHSQATTDRVEAAAKALFGQGDLTELDEETLAGALAGLAGFLWAAQTGYVNPELMGFHMSAHAIMMVILGGMGNFAGAIIGAFSFEYLLHVFKDLPEVAGMQLGKHWQLWMGLFIVALVVFAPRGILGLLQRLVQSKGQP